MSNYNDDATRLSLAPILINSLRIHNISRRLRERFSHAIAASARSMNPKPKLRGRRAPCAVPPVSDRPSSVPHFCDPTRDLPTFSRRKNSLFSGWQSGVIKVVIVPLKLYLNVMTSCARNIQQSELTVSLQAFAVYF